MLRGQVDRIGRAVCAAALVALFGGFASNPNKPVATQVTIVGTDYAFVGIPEKIRAGQAFFAFRNEGKVRHELSFARLKPGISADSVLAEMRSGGRRRNFIDGSGALIVSAPGEESSRARIVLDLKKGENYIVTCTLKDTPDAPPHLMLGMYATFRVY
jgi:hypothetical protein